MRHLAVAIAVLVAIVCHGPDCARLFAQSKLPVFKSPEVRAAERECEAKVKRLRDSYTAAVYALGATLYKLLAGRAPFADEKYEAVINKLMALASETPPPLHELRNDIPRELSDFVARLLAKTPDERPATPREVAEALAPFAEGARLAELMRFVERADETETDGATDTFAHLSFCFTEIHRGAVPKAMVTDVVRQPREKHRISISIDEDAFDDAGIGTDTPITLHLEGIRLECLLSLMLESLDSVWIPDGAQLLITNHKGVKRKLLTVEYDVRDLVMVCGGDRGFLRDVLSGHISPVSWSRLGGHGHVEIAGLGMMTIRHDPHTHRKVERLLNQLRQVRTR